ncbi:MAG: hypothetical protein U0521_16340 [Anaerolineae bacterium]
MRRSRRCRSTSCRSTGQTSVDPQPAYDADGNLAEQTPHPILSDINVRKAIAMGFNIDDVITTLGGADGGVPLVGAVAPTIGWAYDSDSATRMIPTPPRSSLRTMAGWIPMATACARNTGCRSN